MYFHEKGISVSKKVFQGISRYFKLKHLCKQVRTCKEQSKLQNHVIREQFVLMVIILKENEQLLSNMQSNLNGEVYMYFQCAMKTYFSKAANVQQLINVHTLCDIANNSENKTVHY